MTYQPSAQSRLSLRDRAGAITLTVIFHILLAALLLWLTPGILPMSQQNDDLSVFDVPAPTAGEQAPDKTEQKEEQAQKPQQEKAEDRTPPPDPTPVPPVPKPDTPMPKPLVEAPSFIQFSPSQYAAADISKIKSTDAGAAANAANNGSNGKAVQGPGEGPGGVQLYNAQWKREPTGPELAGYLTAGMPRSGYGLIACRTIENFHVDNCRVLGESPLGSGFGQAVRRAAWQFQVLPPRINGKPQVGEWVRIRIDYKEDKASPK